MLCVKDGDKESKLKAVQATDGDAENSVSVKKKQKHFWTTPKHKSITALDFFWNYCFINYKTCVFFLQLYEKSQSENSGIEANDEGTNLTEKSKKEENDLEDEQEDEDDDSSTGSSASITDFVPSAWNSQATPSRPALRSPDKKTVNLTKNGFF